MNVTYFKNIDTSSKSSMLKQIEKLNTDCYPYSIEEGYLYEFATALCVSRGLPGKPFICGNKKEFTGAAMTPLMRLLLQLRDNRDVFEILVKYIDSLPDQDEMQMIGLATDIVENLFANFTSVEQNIIKILYHIEHLFKGVKIDLSTEVAIFESSDFVNKLIKAFIDRSENKEYLAVLFKPILDEISQRSINLHIMRVDDEEPSKVKKDNSMGSASELINYCDQLLESIISKLECMPAGIRYLSKAIETQLKAIFINTLDYASRK